MKVERRINPIESYDYELDGRDAVRGAIASVAIKGVGVLLNVFDKKDFEDEQFPDYGRAYIDKISPVFIEIGEGHISALTEDSAEVKVTTQYNTTIQKNGPKWTRDFETEEPHPSLPGFRLMAVANGKLSIATVEDDADMYLNSGIEDSGTRLWKPKATATFNFGNLPAGSVAIMAAGIGRNSLPIDAQTELKNISSSYYLLNTGALGVANVAIGDVAIGRTNFVLNPGISADDMRMPKKSNT